MPEPKFHTIIFVPHAKGRFRNLRVSDRVLKLGAVALGLVLVLALSSTFTFFVGLRSSSETSRLREENRRLRESAERSAASIDTLRKRIDAFEVKTRRLAILAGMSDVRDLGRGGTGGPVEGSNIGSSSFLGGGESSGSLGEMRAKSVDIGRRLELLDRRFRERQSLLAGTPTIAPVAGIPTNGFGNRADPFEGGREFHQALDISAASGSTVVSPASGVVTKAGWENGYGKVVVISHGHGYTTLYGHLSSIETVEGARVERGQRIGRVGSTGRSTGPHLHYEVKVDGRNENPLAYILDAF
jgi:murein DD-endopeptidase MepM/ murein hydrolase activator NlpD